MYSHSTRLVGASPVVNKRRLLVSLYGGAFCSAIGTVAGAIFLVIMRSLKDGLGAAPEDSFRFLLVALVFVGVQAIPFGLLAGSIGTWWLLGRVVRDTPNASGLYARVVVVSVILGCTFPLLAILLGWGPPENLVSALPVSAGIGLLCGLSLTALIRRYPTYTQIRS